MTLKIVAKYADACNLFGSPDTIRKKLGILRDHCQAVGRDYDSILKTKLGRVMLDRNKEKLEARVAVAVKEVPAEMRKEWLTYGTPDDVRRQLEAFKDVGVEYFIVNLETQRELEALELFGKEIVNKF